MRKYPNLFLAAAFVGIVGCSPVKHVANAGHHITRKTEQVIHTSDHRYAYEDSSGIWWWYFFGPSYYTNTTSASLSSISGGSWTRGSAPTAEEMEDAKTEEVSMEVEAEGEPATAAEVEAEGTGGEGGATGGEGGGDGGGGGGDGGGGGGGD